MGRASVGAVARSRLLLLAAATAAAAALAAGCGGDDDESSAEAWADGVCSAVTTWTDSVTEAAESLTSGDSEDRVETAVDDLREATESLVDDIEELGRPETEAGQEVEQALGGLSDELEADVETIEEAVADADGEGASGALSAISAISGTLVAMGQQVAATVDELERVDTDDELRRAFEEADSCAELRDRAE